MWPEVVVGLTEGQEVVVVGGTNCLGASYQV